MSIDFSLIGNALANGWFPTALSFILLYGFFHLYKTITDAASERENKLQDIITDANNLNKELSQTNHEFMLTLQAFEKDLLAIREDIDTIKTYVEVNENDGR